MKIIYSVLTLTVVLLSCNSENKTSAEEEAIASAAELFEANSKTVMANLKGFQNENLDYSMYADDFAMFETAFSAEKDSLNLEEMKAFDKQMWENYDFKMVNDPVLLPGVKRATTIPDGSVRHYIQWEVTKPATDSTEARSGVIKLYESFDFDENGRIRYQQVYGDFTGLMMHLNNPM